MTGRPVPDAGDVAAACKRPLRLTPPGGPATATAGEGTEPRCFAGNFPVSTGAKACAGRYTGGQSDIPVRDRTIAQDGASVVLEGKVLA